MNVRALTALVALATISAACPSFSSPTSAPAPQAPAPAEMERMITARTSLRGALDDHPLIRPWMIARFDGTTLGYRVLWDPKDPESGQTAEHVPRHSSAGGNSILRVADRYSGVDQLGLACFELLNMDSTDKHDELWSLARRGRIGRDDFARKMTRMEHQAVVRFQNFSREYGLKPAASDVFLQRFLDTPADFDEFLAWSARLRVAEGSTYDPIVYWAQMYDTRRE